MAEASIPVDVFSPGQVFACLGFLEAADLLLGDAEGGFDWTDSARVRFRLSANGDENPFGEVLEFLSQATVNRCAPDGYSDPEGDDAPNADFITLDAFPDREADRMALPVRLAVGTRSIDVSHWADGSGRNPFKLYAGNRSAYSIMCAMLQGTTEKPRKNQAAGEMKTMGIASLFHQKREAMIESPFDVLTPMAGSFNFDPRGGWTAIDAGYSPNEHSDHRIVASPAVEVLAAIGLEHARPDEFERRCVRYGVWSGMLPPSMARPILGAQRISVSIRTFCFILNLSGKNKVVTVSQEEKKT